MIDPETLSTRLGEFVAHLFPYEHGHRQKAITAFVAALIVQQTCCQAGLARAIDNFEAAVKRLSRLIHNERLKDRRAADAILQQSLRQLPAHGPVRLVIDWTIEGAQYHVVPSTTEQKIGSLRCLGCPSPVTERPFSPDRSIWE